MKKTIITMASFLMLGLAVNAQVTGTLSSPENPSTTQSVNTGASLNQSTSANRVQVQTDDLPSSMRQTLSDAEYAGWENAPIYQDQNTNEYSFSLQSDGTSKTYSFDQNGNAITGGNILSNNSTSTGSNSSGSISENAPTVNTTTDINGASKNVSPSTSSSGSTYLTK